MYRIAKVLNHNALIGVEKENAQKYLVEISQRLKLSVEEVEIGYLAMHMERMMAPISTR